MISPYLAKKGDIEAGIQDMSSNIDVSKVQMDIQPITGGNSLGKSVLQVKLNKLAWQIGSVGKWPLILYFLHCI